MSKPIGFTSHRSKYFFIRNIEDSCDSRNQFQYGAPYPFADCDFKTVLVGKPEEFANCLVGFKSLYDREHIPLVVRQRKPIAIDLLGHERLAFLFAAINGGH